MIYCYTTEANETFEYPFPIGEAPETVTVEGGFVAVRNIPAEHRSPNSAKKPKPYATIPKWPMKSISCGVSPRQIDVAAKYDHDNGVTTNYKKTGEVIWDNPKHRAEWCRLHKGIDLDGGYSDYVGE